MRLWVWRPEINIHRMTSSIADCALVCNEFPLKLEVDCLSSELQGSHCLLPPTAHTLPGSACGCWGPTLRPSSLHGKHSAHLASSPSSICYWPRTCDSLTIACEFIIRPRNLIWVFSLGSFILTEIELARDCIIILVDRRHRQEGRTGDLSPPQGLVLLCLLSIVLTWATQRSSKLFTKR